MIYKKIIRPDKTSIKPDDTKILYMKDEND